MDDARHGAAAIVRAPTGLALQCEPGAAWHKQCRLAIGADSDRPVSFALRVSQDGASEQAITAGAVGDLEILSRDAVPHRINIAVAAPHMPPDVQLFTGRACLDADPSDGALCVPLYAALWRATKILEIDDPARAAIPDGGLAVQLGVRGAGAHRWVTVLRDDAEHALPWLVEISPAENGEALAGMLIHSLQGRAAVRWRVHLLPTLDQLHAPHDRSENVVLADGAGAGVALSAERWTAPAHSRAWMTAAAASLSGARLYDALGSEALPTTASSARAAAQLLSMTSFDGQTSGGPVEGAISAITLAVGRTGGALIAVWPSGSADEALRVAARGGGHRREALVACLVAGIPLPEELKDLDCARVVAGNPINPAADDRCLRTDARVLLPAPARQHLYEVLLCPSGIPLPASRRLAMEGPLCFDPSASPADGPLVTTSLAPTTPGVAEDARCATGSTAYPMQAFVEAPISGEGRVAWLGACLADLTRRPPSQPRGPEIWRDARAEPAACFRPLNFYGALQPATARALVSDDAAARLTHRLLQQYADLHATLAREGLVVSQLAEVLRRERLGSVAPALYAAPTSRELAATIRQGILFLVSDSGAARLADASPAVLRYPDYRSRAPLKSGDPSWQEHGLSVSLLDAATGYVRVVADSLEDAPEDTRGASDPTDDAANRTAEALRLALALRAHAELLYTGAQDPALPGAVAWRRAYLSARANLDAALKQLRRAEARGSDDWSRAPLGADEVSLAFADPRGDSGQFFAASDYLLETVAEPAMTRLLTVRHTELQALWQGIADSVTETRRREDAVRELSIMPLLQACGLRDADVALAHIDRDPASAARCFAPAGDGWEQGSAGEVGEAAAAVEVAERGLLRARGAADHHRERYERGLQFCRTLEVGLLEDAEISAQAYEEIRQMRQDATAYDLAAVESKRREHEAQEGGKDAAKRRPFPAKEALAARLRELERAIEEERDSLAERLARRANARAVRACFDQAHAHMLAFRTDLLQVAQQTAQREAAALHLTAERERVARLAAEAVVRRGRHRSLGRPHRALEDQLAQTVEIYRGQFRWARRALLSALRAIEYESQACFLTDAPILDARSSADLQRELVKLKSFMADRRVNVRRPGRHIRLVSLRDDVLRLADRVADPSGHPDATRAERFGTLLASEDAALYSADGTYLGQGFRFALPESGYAECAERLDRVGVRLDGAGALSPHAKPVRVQIFKDQLFGSHWCSGLAPPASTGKQWMRLPSTRLTSHLTGDFQRLPDSVLEHGVALVDAHPGVAAGQFAEPTHSHGFSGELMGQGIFGTYTVMLPDVDPAALAALQDIVLRLDYVSVADPGRLRPGD